ncbi:hypothetical protein GCM10009552_02690 [Rothia nasimurium]
MAERNAVSVLPEPVGAATSVWRPERIIGHAAICASVGAGKVASNQVVTAGWNSASGIDFCEFIEPLKWGLQTLLARSKPSADPPAQLR